MYARSIIETASKWLTPAAVQQAMRGAVLILNDDVDGAERVLSEGHTAFHKLGVGTVWFLKAVLGFERDVMKEAGRLLAEAESAAADAQAKAHRGGHQSDIYPAGSEYALCNAEAQLMSAVIGVLTESVTEAIKGFYKLRKAYIALQEISEAEKKYLQTRGATNTAGSASTSKTSLDSTATTNQPPGYSHPPTKSVGNTEVEDDESDLEFVDADDGTNGKASTNTYQGHLSTAMNSIGISATPAGKTFDDDRLHALLSHPVDIFIHSGTAMCFGMLQLLLSLIPPTFSKLLSIVGFRGNQAEGLKLLWSATKDTESINGGMAALMLLGHYSNMVNFCDILQTDTHVEQECQELLTRMRTTYPNSRLWLLEEARLIATHRRMNKSIALIEGDARVAPLKQLEALKYFELSLEYLYSGQWEKCAQGWIKCIDLNSWSPALYYFFAAICYIELYRATPTSSPELRKKYSSRADELLEQVPIFAGKRRFMARQMPFDAYVTRKAAKWTAAAARLDCAMVDTVGPSPAEEIIYFWAGDKRRNEQQLRDALARLERYTDTDGTPSSTAATATQWRGPVHATEDDKAVYHVLHAALRQRLFDVHATATHPGPALGFDQAAIRAELALVTDQDWATYKAAVVSNAGPSSAQHGDTWPLPVACYEMAVVEWSAYNAANRESKGADGKAHLDQCAKWIARVAGWEGYELDTRIGIKVRAAQETLRKVGAVGGS